VTSCPLEEATLIRPGTSERMATSMRKSMSMRVSRLILVQLRMRLSMDSLTDFHKVATMVQVLVEPLDVDLACVHDSL